MHVEKIFSCLLNAAKNESPIVQDYARRSSVLCGYFLEPDVWTSFLLPRLEATPTKEHLLLLGGLLRGAHPPTLAPLLPQLCDQLASDAICYSLDQRYLTEMLYCVEGLPESQVQEESEASILKLCLAIVGLGEREVREGGRRCLQGLAGGHGQEALLRKLLPPILASYLTTAPTWSSISYEKKLFEAVVHECPSVLGYFPKEVLFSVISFRIIETTGRHDF